MNGVKYLVLSLLLVAVFASVLFMVSTDNIKHSSSQLQTDTPIVQDNSTTYSALTANNNSTTQPVAQVNSSSPLTYGVYIYNGSVYIYLNVSFYRVTILNVTYLRGGPVMPYNGVSEVQNSTLAKILVDYKNVTITIFDGKSQTITLPVIITTSKLTPTAFFYPSTFIIPMLDSEAT